MSTSQTLDRGLAMLESIAWAAAPPTIDELAEVHGVHRSIAYRIVRTLEARHLVRRDTSGRCHAGVRLASLARGVRAPLLTAAVPALTSLANELGMTSFLVVRDGDEAVTIESIEPQTSEIHLAYRPGIRHPVELGAPGLALLAGSPLVDGERADVAARPAPRLGRLGGGGGARTGVRRRTDRRRDRQCGRCGRRRPSRRGRRRHRRGRSPRRGRGTFDLRRARRIGPADDATDGVNRDG